jgi:hypothetical protein
MEGMRGVTRISDIFCAMVQQRSIQAFRDVWLLEDQHPDELEDWIATGKFFRESRGFSFFHRVQNDYGDIPAPRPSRILALYGGKAVGM